MANIAGVIKQLEIQRKSIAGQLSNVSAAVAALRGISVKGATVKSITGRPSRTMSASARKRIAAAQKKRWAKWHLANKRAA
jgi:hypothetical protein